MEIRKQFGTVEIAQVKSLPKVKRNGLLMKVKDIDGGLIGGASLKSRDFVDIIKAFNS